METINLSYIYADRDGYDECMRAGLRLPCPLDCTSACIIYLQLYSS